MKNILKAVLNFIKELFTENKAIIICFLILLFVIFFVRETRGAEVHTSINHVQTSTTSQALQAQPPVQPLMWPCSICGAWLCDYSCITFCSVCHHLISNCICPTHCDLCGWALDACLCHLLCTSCGQWLDNCACCPITGQPYCYCDQHPIDITEIINAIMALRDELITTQAYINHGIEAKTANLLWLVGLNSFGIGISVMTIFAIQWGRTR